MRTIKTTTGASIALDGDLLAILEALYREITVKRDFAAKAHKLLLGSLRPGSSA